jgi:gas vesicle protein
MQTTVLKLLGGTLIAATTIQVADAAGNHARKARAPAAIEQLRNSNAQLRDSSSNAYAGLSDLAAQSYRSSLDEGAMSSGMAGH